MPHRRDGGPMSTARTDSASDEPLANYDERLKDYIAKLDKKLEQAERHTGSVLKLKDAMKQRMRQAEDETARDVEANDLTSRIMSQYDEMEGLLSNHKAEILERLGKARDDLRKVEVQSESRADGET